MLRGKLLGRELAIVEFEAVVRRRVVVLVDVDAIHDVDQFAEEEPRRQRHLATKARGHLADESAQEPIVDALGDPLGILRGIEIPDALPDREQPLVSERKKPHLRRAQVVEAAVLRRSSLGRADRAAPAPSGPCTPRRSRACR